METFGRYSIDKSIVFYTGWRLASTMTAQPSLSVWEGVGSSVELLCSVFRAGRSPGMHTWTKVDLYTTIFALWLDDENCVIQREYLYGNHDHIRRTLLGNLVKDHWTREHENGAKDPPLTKPICYDRNRTISYIFYGRKWR